MDKVNGIDMNFIYKKRGHSPETKRLWVERNHILKPDRTRFVGKGKASERIQEYRPNQAAESEWWSSTPKYITVSFIIAKHSGQRPCRNTSKTPTIHGCITTNQTEILKQAERNKIDAQQMP